MTPPPIPEDKRDIMREVALTYRRVRRANVAAGMTIQDAHRLATDACIAAYQRLDASAPRVEASGMALLMLANAIHADIAWFWDGPDA